MTIAEPLRRLRWAHGEAELQCLGAMLGPVRFEQAGAGAFSPLHVAPWADEPGLEDFPPALQKLRGDWPCLPFGRCDRPEGLPAAWAGLEPGDAFGHGYSVHHDWDWIDTADPLTLALGLDIPEPSAVARLERSVTADPLSCALVSSVRAFARRPATLPMALHPTFSLAQGRVQLRVGGFSRAHAYPVPAESGVSQLVPSAIFDRLDAAPGLQGPLDLTQLPLAMKTEELLQLQDAAGTVELDYLDRGWRVALSWPQAVLPDVMLWVSNGGRAAAPWSGRHFALGVEPVNSLFDLGRVAAADASHPLAARHGVTLSPDAPFELSYWLSATPLPAA